jgi:hypothetical protein
MDTLLKWTYRVPDLVTLGHDQCRATVVLHAAKPAGIKIGSDADAFRSNCCIGGFASGREADATRRKLNSRAALSVLRLPSLSPRIVCSCRCVVQEATLGMALLGAVSMLHAFKSSDLMALT